MVIEFSSPLKDLSSILLCHHKENMLDSWCSIKTSHFSPLKKHVVSKSRL